MKQSFALAKRYIGAHRRLVTIMLVLTLLIPVAAIFGSQAIINTNKQHILSKNSNQHTTVGIVLGAGVTKDGKPYQELQARLDVAAKALADGRVDKLILSGDNRFKHYNEPNVMRDYLIKTHGISTRKLQPDYAGRSTYESCERAAKVFDLDTAIIFSNGSHLPRAIFLCRHFGVEAYGIDSGVEHDGATRRELMASTKAIFNAYIYGEQTILGAKVTF